MVGRFLFKLLFLRGSLFEIIISYHHLLIIWLKNLPGHNVGPKLRFCQTWADCSWTLSDDRQIFAALGLPHTSCSVDSNSWSSHIVRPSFLKYQSRRILKLICRNVGTMHNNGTDFVFVVLLAREISFVTGTVKKHLNPAKSQHVNRVLVGGGGRGGGEKRSMSTRSE